MIKTPNATVSKALKRLHYPLDIMLTCVRWYIAYPLSLRHLEEMMSERAMSVDQSTVRRWAIKLLPALGKAFGVDRIKSVTTSAIKLSLRALVSHCREKNVSVQ
jgi:transposase-like protein